MKRAYMSRLREEQAEATRVRILEAVARVLARGVVELSVPSVAREAGVAVATVYRHFPTKYDVVHGLGRHIIELQGAGWDAMSLNSLEELEPKFLEIGQRRARLDLALRQATAHPEMNRARGQSRELRQAAAEKALAPLLVHLPPLDRRRALEMIVLLSSSPTANAREILIGPSHQGAVARRTLSLL